MAVEQFAIKNSLLLREGQGIILNDGIAGQM
jgi:hypothetical protein